MEDNMQLELVSQRREVDEAPELPEVPETRNYIEANTNTVSLSHLKDDCIIPTFRDSEKTISHYEFIEAMDYSVKQFFRDEDILTPDIRVSHKINGRIPQALHKKVHELEEWEKTRYYERMMFIIEIPSINANINGNTLNLTVGGVRALNHESLFSKKSIEKFKVFIGFQNLVCINLLVTTDGAMLDLRVASVTDLIKNVQELFEEFSIVKQLNHMKDFSNYFLTEHQFAQVIGRSRLYQHLPAAVRKNITPLDFNDRQLNLIAKDYYHDQSFCRLENGDIDLWRLYGLFTGSNKTSYIDSFLGRSVNAYTFIRGLQQALRGDDQYHWFLS
jgi:hypothetical protein